MKRRIGEWMERHDVLVRRGSRDTAMPELYAIVDEWVIGKMLHSHGVGQEAGATDTRESIGKWLRTEAATWAAETERRGAPGINDIVSYVEARSAAHCYARAAEAVEGREDER